MNDLSCRPLEDRDSIGSPSRTRGHVDDRYLVRIPVAALLSSQTHNWIKQQIDGRRVVPSILSLGTEGNSQILLLDHENLLNRFHHAPDDTNDDKKLYKGA